MTEEHDIKWAADRMDEGKRVQRPKHARRGESYGLHDGRIFLFDEGRPVCEYDNYLYWSPEDLRATDWEIAP